MEVKFKAILDANIPPLESREIGTIYYTGKGNHYLVKSDKSLLKLTDTVFFSSFSELVSSGIQDESKIYLVDYQLYVYSLGRYIPIKMMSLADMSYRTSYLNGEVSKIEYSKDSFTTILIEVSITYVNDLITEIITKDFNSGVIVTEIIDYLDGNITQKSSSITTF